LIEDTDDLVSKPHIYQRYRNDAASRRQGICTWRQRQSSFLLMGQAAAGRRPRQGDRG
jgi:hypothetical protein